MSVVKRHWRRFLVAALVLIVGAALLLWSRPAAQAKLEALDLDDGGHATLAEPGEKPRSRVVVIAAPEQQLNEGCAGSRAGTPGNLRLPARLLN